MDAIDYMEGYVGMTEEEAVEMDEMWARYDSHDCRLKDEGTCEVCVDFTGYVNS